MLYKWYLLEVGTLHWELLKLMKIWKQSEAWTVPGNYEQSINICRVWTWDGSWSTVSHDLSLLRANWWVTIYRNISEIWTKDVLDSFVNSLCNVGNIHNSLNCQIMMNLWLKQKIQYHKYIVKIQNAGKVQLFHFMF